MAQARVRTSRLFVGTLAASAVLLALATATRAAAVEQVERFDGSATDIGIQREPGGTGGVEYRIRGEFDYAGEIDFARSTLTWVSLLEEIGPGGAGELITMRHDLALVPLVILPRRHSTADKAVYETHRFRPQTRMQIKQKAGRFEFRLKLDRGLSRKVPALCTGEPAGQKSLFRHHFVIDDGVNPPLDVVHVQLWDCSNLEGFQLKAKTPNTPRSSPRPTGTPAPPTPTPIPAPANDGSVRASLVVEPQSRNSGQPDPVLLDGRDSSDRNGTIVRYVFESGDGRVQDGAQPTATFVYPPGSYVARLIAIDDQGNGAVATRSFSEK